MVQQLKICTFSKTSNGLKGWASKSTSAFSWINHRMSYKEKAIRPL